MTISIRNCQNIRVAIKFLYTKSNPSRGIPTKLALDYQKGVISKITGILVCYRQMKSNVSILILEARYCTSVGDGDEIKGRQILIIARSIPHMPRYNFFSMCHCQSRFGIATALPRINTLQPGIFIFLLHPHLYLKNFVTNFCWKFTFYMQRTDKSL